MIAEFEKNQCVVALALWRIAVDFYKFAEATKHYRQDAGSVKLHSIVRKMELALTARVFTRLRFKVTWAIFQDRNVAALVLQRLVHRVRGKTRFLAMHDSRPIGGLLADIDMDPCRFLAFQVSPRIREDKRRFWKASKLMQAKWRAVVHARWWKVLRLTVIRLQASIRVAPVIKIFHRMKIASVIIEALFRMTLARWPYLRRISKVLYLQRIIRGHKARIIAFDMLIERRRLLKVCT